MASIFLVKFPGQAIYTVVLLRLLGIIADLSGSTSTTPVHGQDQRRTVGQGATQKCKELDTNKKHTKKTFKFNQEKCGSNHNIL
jgi:hypothetical protein